MTRTAAVAAIAVVTVVVASLAAADGDDTVLTLPAADVPLQRVITIVFAVGVAAAVATLAFVRPAAVAEQRPRSRRSMLSMVVVVLLAVVVATAIETARDTASEQGSAATPSEASPDDDPGAAVEVEPRGVATALVTVLVVGLLVAVAAHSRRRRSVTGADAGSGDEALREAVRSGRAALDGPTTAAGPRQAVLACWRVLEAELGALDRPRRDHETGAEYLRRALAPLRPPPAPVQRLATLVELARWSTAAIDERDVGAARAALDEVLDGIAVEVRG